MALCRHQIKLQVQFTIITEFVGCLRIMIELFLQNWNVDELTISIHLFRKVENSTDENLKSWMLALFISCTRIWIKMVTTEHDDKDLNPALFLYPFKSIAFVTRTLSHKPSFHPPSKPNLCFYWSKQHQRPAYFNLRPEVWIWCTIWSWALQYQHPSWSQFPPTPTCPLNPQRTNQSLRTHSWTQFSCKT